jgi:hypothetical protein
LTSSQDAAAPEPRSTMLLLCGLLLTGWQLRQRGWTGRVRETGPPSTAPPAGP